MSDTRFSDPEPLDRQETKGFSCGRSALDAWLVDHARTATAAGSARTYVVTDRQQGDRVVGFTALTAAGVEPGHAPSRVRTGMPQHPIPVVLLARLAVDSSVQGRGVGAFLLADAMRRTLAAADVIAVRALLVHAKDDAARGFYRRFGFASSPSDPLHLMLLIKDLRASLPRAG